MPIGSFFIRKVCLSNGFCQEDVGYGNLILNLKREMESNIYYDIYDARNEISQHIELNFN
jgi:hypothetical protein